MPYVMSIIKMQERTFLVVLPRVRGRHFPSRPWMQVKISGRPPRTHAQKKVNQRLEQDGFSMTELKVRRYMTQLGPRTLALSQTSC